VEIIGDPCFECGSRLAKITFENPSRVKAIEELAFYGCQFA
jgi:hypothetical protein